MKEQKQRILNAIRGEKVDRVPFSPFLAYWWEQADDTVREMGQEEFCRSNGCDPMMRGFFCPTWVDFHCASEEYDEGGLHWRILKTSSGELKFGYKYASEGDTTFLVNHPIQNEDDLDIMIELMRGATLETVDNIADAETQMSVNDDVLYVGMISPFGKTPFQTMVEEWFGTVELTYALADYPEKVEECLAIMDKLAIEAAQIAVEVCSAEAYIFWEDSSTTNISPAMFERYTAPVIKRWAEILHAKNKLLIHHACGHIKDLLPLMAQTGIDAIESISPPPTGNIELWEARKLLPDNVALIGGIEPTVFMNANPEELEAYVNQLISKMEGTRFVLANSDSCPPNVKIDRFALVADIVKKRI